MLSVLIETFEVLFLQDLAVVHADYNIQDKWSSSLL